MENKTEILDELGELESEIFGSPAQAPGVDETVESTELSTEILGWGQLQESILDALLEGEEGWDEPGIRSLAKRLKTTVEELRVVMESSDRKKWEIRRMEKLVEAEAMRKRGFNWDRLEHSALIKLATLVDTNRVKSVGDLLAIARAANQATRRDTQMPNGQNPSGGNFTQVNVNFQGGNGDGPNLPGPGNLGTIQLSLSQRTIQQISQGKTIEGEALNLAEGAEMLQAEDIKELNSLVDDES